jgi:signal transduction histidine kinase
MRLLKNILFFVFFCFSFFFGLSADDIKQNAKATRGIADLRNVSLDSFSFALTGEWKFASQQLLSPIEARNINSFFSIPSLWNKKSVNGKPLSAEGYATYAITVLLPKHRPALALEIPDAYSSLRVYVNNKVAFESGYPDSTSNKAIPHWQTATLPIEVESDTLNIVLYVANFWHSKGGINEAVVLGDRETLLLKREQGEAFDLLLTGCLFMGGLFFFGLYLFGKHDRAILFFSLFCMVYSYRVIGTDMYTLHSIFPNLSWDLTIRLEYLTLYLSIGLFVQYTSSLYPQDVNKKAMIVLTTFCGLFALSVLFPPSFFTKLINPFLVVMFALIGYAFYVYLIAMRRKRIGSQYALISTAVVLFVFALINLSYFQLIPPFRGLVFMGYIAFFFLQSLILSYRFATTLKIAKQQAEEGLQAKSSFLSTMSHEIRTPLNSVIGTAHIMLKNQPREDQKQQLDILLFSANNLLGLVNDVLDFNKIEANKIHFENIALDVKDLTEKVIASLKPLAAEKNIDIIDNIDAIDKVLGDPMRLSQVLTNLIHNAVKFTEAGTVLVKVEKKKETAQQLSLQFSIVDTGIGIPAEKQTLIFEQFTQADSSTSRSFGGTGLGLAITKRIIEQQGSYLHLKSVPNEGSTFYFTFDFDKAPHTSIEKPIPMKSDSATEQFPLKGVRILLVEDNALNIFVAQSFLEQWGAEIDVAENGQLAVDVIDPQKHDVVLMDMHMPVMDGYEAVGLIRNKGIQTPIIALTASISKEAESRVMKVGANGFIVKPFEPDSLLATVQKFVKR